MPAFTRHSEEGRHRSMRKRTTSEARGDDDMVPLLVEGQHPPEGALASGEPLRL